MNARSTSLLLVFLLAACGGAPGATQPPSPQPPSGGPPAGLDGRTFLSTTRTKAGVDFPLVAGTQIRLSFNPDGNLGASAGCNMIGGTYRLDGGILRFTGGGMTEMGCDAPRHAQDDWLGSFLGAAPTLSLSGTDLVLTAGDTTVTLVDREVADPDLPLVGPVWRVGSIISGGSVSSVPDAPAATLTFHDDGRVDVLTGCNQGGGTFTNDAGELRFVDIALTKRACDAVAGQLEAAVLEILRAERVAWRIDAGNLTLEVGDRGLVLEA